MPRLDPEKKVETISVDPSAGNPTVVDGKPAVLSGVSVGQALLDRFEEVTRAETARLSRKLSALSESDRLRVEAVIVDVVCGPARAAARALTDHTRPQAVEAVVRLFRLNVT